MTDRDATPLQHANFRITHTAHGVTLDFPPLRAPGAALGLLAFAALCGLMPALGLGALLPIEGADAAAVVSLALIGGFAAPFILASVVFTLLAIYQLANALHVEIGNDGVHTQRRVFGCVTQRRHIARADIADIEPRISARLQNLFSSTPRYALIARHAQARVHDVVIAEDLAGAAVMQALQDLTRATLEKNIQ